MSKLLHRFLLMGALLMCAAGCSDDKTEDSTAPSFSITVPASEFYQATVAESAKAGDVVPLSIKMTEGMEIVSVQLQRRAMHVYLVGRRDQYVQL